MKTIKYLSLFLGFVINWSLYSCGEDYSSPLSNLSIDDVIVKYDQKTATIKIGNDNLESFETFSISSSANWCKVQFDEIWKNNVNIKIDKNTSYDERRALITITDPEDGTNLLINIIQEPEYVYLSDKDTYEIPEEGGQISINLKSNVDYSVVIPDDASWLTCSKTRGLSQSTLTFTASKNESGEERIAIVSLNGPTTESSSHLIIKQLITPYINPEPAVYKADDNGGDIEILVSTNVDVETYINSDWIKDVGRISKDGRNFIQKIKISPLGENKKRRTARISFYSKNEALNGYAVVSITQGFDFSIRNGDIEINVGESYSLSLDTQYEGDIIWISSNTSIATVNNKGKVTGVGKGSATITAKSSDGKLSDQCVVTVKDITDLITARTGSSSVMSINGLIQYGSVIGWVFVNNSTKTVRLKSMQLVDGENGYEGNIMTIDEDVSGGSSVGYSTTIGVLGIHAPVTCRFRYTYNGKEYMTTAVYSM